MKRQYRRSKELICYKISYSWVLCCCLGAQGRKNLKVNILIFCIFEVVQCVAVFTGYAVLHLVGPEHSRWLLKYQCLPFQGLLSMKPADKAQLFSSNVFLRTKWALLPSLEWCVKYFVRVHVDAVTIMIMTIIIMLFIE